MNQFGGATLLISAVFLLVATIFVALRLVSRIFVARKITLSDYVLCVGWALVCILSVAIFSAAVNGLGVREGVLPEWKQPLARAEYAFTVFYNPALTAVKSSFLIFYLTLSKGHSLFRLGTYLTLGIVIAAGLVLTLVNIAQCHPVASAIQYPTPPDAYCIDIVALYLSTAPINIVTDIAIFFLPIPTLWRMRLPKKQKIILLLVFGTGLFVSVISIIRTLCLLKAAIARVTQLHPPGVHDLSYYDAYLFMWSAIELNLGIICSCVPSLKPLMERILPRIIRNSKETHNTRSLVAEHENSTSWAATSRNQESSAEGLTCGTTERAPFFDFVIFIYPKSMLKMSNKESSVPIAVMCVIFLLWGFAYGFIHALNTQFWQVAGYGLQTCFELHAAYFGGYVFGPILVARPILKQWGFKVTLMTGLSIYSCGTLVFWPAAILISLPGFVIANFIVGLGLSVVETAADLFISLCGPTDHAEIRLNLAHGVQAVGGIASPILAQQVLFKGVRNAPALISAQWIYLGITIVTILVAVVYSFLKLPEASNDELKQLADRRRKDYDTDVCGIRVVWVTLALGVLSQFCNVGGQEDLQTTFGSFVAYNESTPHPQAFGFLAIEQTLLAVGHFLAAFAQRFIKPRRILLGLYLGVILFSVLSMTTTGYTGITIGLLLILSNAGIFSITFAICLRGMGQHTITAASIMATAISGGAPFPVIQNMVATSYGTRYAFCVNLVLFLLGAVFPLYLNLVPAARKQVDPTKDEDLDYLPREL